MIFLHTKWSFIAVLMADLGEEVVTCSLQSEHRFFPKPLCEVHLQNSCFLLLISSERDKFLFGGRVHTPESQKWNLWICHSLLPFPVWVFWKNITTVNPGYPICMLGSDMICMELLCQMGEALLKKLGISTSNALSLNLPKKKKRERIQDMIWRGAKR